MPDLTPPFRILFLGQKPLGELCFSLLQDHQNETLTISGTCSNRSAKSVWWGSNSIFGSTNEDNFIDCQENNQDKLLKYIKTNDINLLMSVQHPHVLNSEILRAVNNQAFNLHRAPLPDYQGFYSLNHALLNNEERFGTTLHWMTDTVDEGAIAYEKKFTIEPGETALSLYTKTLKHSLTMFETFLSDLKNNSKVPEKPMTEEGTYYSNDSIEGMKLVENPFDASEEALRKIHAFYFPPFEPAYTRVSGSKVFLTPKDKTTFNPFSLEFFSKSLNQALGDEFRWDLP